MSIIKIAAKIRKAIKKPKHNFFWVHLTAPVSNDYFSFFQKNELLCTKFFWNS